MCNPGTETVLNITASEIRTVGSTAMRTVAIPTVSPGVGAAETQVVNLDGIPMNALVVTNDISGEVEMFISLVTGLVFELHPTERYSPEDEEQEIGSPADALPAGVR